MPSLLPSARINLALLIIVAISSLLAIKVVNNIVPKRFYFSISSLVKGTDEPFIIEPPSISGAKLCQLLWKYGVDPQDTKGIIDKYTNCKEIHKDDAKQKDYTAEPLDVSASVRDAVYRRAFVSDATASSLLLADVARIVQGLPADQLAALLDTAHSEQDAFNKINAQYKQLIATDSSLSPFIQSNFENLIQDTRQQGETPVPSDADGSSQETLTDAQREKIQRAHDEFLRAIAATNFASTIKGMNVANIENIVSQLNWPSQLPELIEDYYRRQADAVIREKLATSFVNQGLPLVKSGTERDAILGEIYNFTIKDYIIATFIRILPIFIVGGVFGLLCGRTELNAVSLGGAFAAFLLVWPLILMWDTIVQGKWQENKNIFLLLYLIYVVSFYFIARTGGVVGAAIGSRFNIAPLSDATPAGRDSPGAYKYLRDIYVNIAASVIFSFLTVAFNLLIPRVL